MFIGRTHSPVTTTSSTCHFRWEIFLFPVGGVEAKNGSKPCQMFIELARNAMRAPDPEPSANTLAAHRKWILNFSTVHVCHSAEGHSVYAVSHGRRYDDVIKFSRFSLLSSGDNAPPSYRPRTDANTTCTHSHTHTHTYRAVLWSNEEMPHPARPLLLEKCLLFDKGAIYLMIILCLFSNAYAVVCSLRTRSLLSANGQCRIRLYRITKMVFFIFTENRLISVSTPVSAIYFIIDMLFVFVSHSVFTRLNRYAFHLNVRMACSRLLTFALRFLCVSRPGPTEIE